MRSTLVKVIRMSDYGRRMLTGVHAQQVHDQIAQALKASSRVRLDFADVESVGATFLDRSLGALVARHGAAVLQSLVFAHCSPSVAASIGKALPQAGPIRELRDFSAPPGASADVNKPDAFSRQNPSNRPKT